MNWLITGGAGYIGSHVVEEFQNRASKIVVVDNLRTGLRDRIGSGISFYQTDIRDSESVQKIIAKENIQGIVHLAALKSISESINNSTEYHDVNYHGSINLMTAAVRNGIEKFIFSSTAAVYKGSEKGGYSENSPTFGNNPYSISKLESENNLKKLKNQGLIDGVSLRYFNVIGSKKTLFQERNGQNLLPIVLRRIERNLPPEIYGKDYETPDGTCVRDYIDVRDVAKAHLESAYALKLPHTLNLGSGTGTSVRQLIDHVISELDVDMKPIYKERRTGDLAHVVANVSLAKEVLNFVNSFSLKQSIQSAISKE